IRFNVMVVIPEPDNWLRQVMLIADRAETGRIQQKIPSPNSRAEAQPAGDQYANKMSTGKKKYIFGNITDPCDDTVRALADFCGRLTLRSAIAEKLPVRVFLENLR